MDIISLRTEYSVLKSQTERVAFLIEHFGRKGLDVGNILEDIKAWMCSVCGWPNYSKYINCANCGTPHE